MTSIAPEPSEREVQALEAWARLEQLRAQRIGATERSQTHSIEREAKLETNRKARRRQAKAARKRNR